MIIVDTSAWIFLFQKKSSGENSQKAKEFYQRNRKTLAVTDLIIEETHKWLVHHGHPQKLAIQILNTFVTEELANILPIHPEDRVVAKNLVEKYLDHSLSFTDALTVVLMKRHQIKEIFSFDSDFDLFRGITRLPR